MKRKHNLGENQTPRYFGQSETQFTIQWLVFVRIGI